MSKLSRFFARQSLAIVAVVAIVAIACVFLRLAPLTAADPATRSTAQKLEKIVLPKLDLNRATLQESVEYLRNKSIELDPARKGISFIILRSQFEQLRPAGEIEALTKEVERSNERMLSRAKEANIIPGDDAVILETYRMAKIRFEEAKVSEERQRNLIAVRLDLDGTRLINLLASEGKSNVIGDLYRKHLDAKRELAILDEGEAEGTAEQQVRATAVVEHLRTQLMDAVEHYKRSLGTALEVEEENVASAKRSLWESGEELIDRQSRSSEYLAAKRDYERKLAGLVALEDALAAPTERLGLATLEITGVPLGAALEYIAQQIGVSYAVRDHAVVVGSAEEIAKLR